MVPVAADRDGILVAVVLGNVISVREPETGEVVTTLAAPGAVPTAVELVPDTPLLARDI